MIYMPKKLNKNTLHTMTVVRHLAASGASTQIQVTQQIDLRRTSVFNVFENMEKSGLLETGSNIALAGKGRPRQLWQLNGALGAFAAVYLNSHNRTLQLVDFNGQLLFHHSEPACGSIEADLEAAVRQLAEAGAGRPLSGLVLLLPGRVNFTDGVVSCSRSLELENCPARDILAAKLRPFAPDALILIENNARMAAWGQHCGGACTGIDDFLALLVLDGKRNGKVSPISIGSGMVVDGKVYRGCAGGAGELDDSCHRWWNKVYGGQNFPVTLSEVDRESRRYFAARLGESFAHIVNYLEPKRMVVIFEQSPVEDFFLELRRKIHDNLIYIDKNDFSIELSSDGVGSTIRGGLALLRTHFFASDELLLKIIG